MIGIYKITNPIGQVYIGQSKDIMQRVRIYKCKGKIGKSLIDLSIDTHGFDNHIFEIIYECESNMLNYYEAYFILKYLVTGKILNTRIPNIDKYTFEKKYIEKVKIIDTNKKIKNQAGRKSLYPKGKQIVTNIRINKDVAEHQKKAVQEVLKPFYLLDNETEKDYNERIKAMLKK